MLVDQGVNYHKMFIKLNFNGNGICQRGCYNHINMHIKVMINILQKFKDNAYHHKMDND